MAHAKSISIDELTDLAHGSAKKIVGDRLAEIGAEAEIGFFPDFGIFGIIIQDPKILERLPAFEMLEMSAEIAGSIRLDVELKPAAGLTRDFGTMGFFPPIPIDVRKF